MGRRAPHLTRQVGTFIGIVMLHAAWDASNGWAITLTQGILGDGWTLDWPRTKDWVGFPTGQELEVYNAISFALLVVIAAIGTLWLVRRWRGLGSGSPPRPRARGRSDSIAPSMKPAQPL